MPSEELHIHPFDSMRVQQVNFARPAGVVLDELLAEVRRFTDDAPFADDVCLVAAEVPL